jgi:hypothetical protein
MRTTRSLALAKRTPAPRRPCRLRSISPRATAAFAVALCAILLGGHAHAEEAAVRQPGVRLRVPHSLPVVGESQQLTAYIRYPADDAKDARVVFSVAEPGAAGERKLAEVPVKLGGTVAEPVAHAEWTPGKARDYALTARLDVRFDDGWKRNAEAKQTVVAARRRLHFHYWDLATWNRRADLTFVTEGLLIVPRGTPAAPAVEYWTDRGVIPQRWKGGTTAWKQLGKAHPDESTAQVNKRLVDYYVAGLDAGYPGFVIDEFTSGKDADGVPIVEHVGKAVGLTRERRPEANIAIYSVGAVAKKGTNKLDGFMAADRILIESYLWRPLGSIASLQTVDYGRHRQRWGQAVDSGVSGHSLLALCLGGRANHYNANNGITTPRELRRQLHWVRYNFPDMAGIALYGSAPDIGIDEQLQGFYADPVLRAAQDENGVVRVSNIGGDHAPATRIKLAGQNGSRQELDVDVPALKVDEAFAFGVLANGRVVAVGTGKELPDGLEHQLLPISEYREGLFVLGPPLLMDWEPARFRPGATDPWPEPGPVAATVQDLLSNEPSKGEGNENEKNALPPLCYDVEPTNNRSFLLTFEMLTGAALRGGPVDVCLRDKAGPASLLFRVSNVGAYQGAGQPGWSQFQVHNTEGWSVKEYMAARIKPNSRYQYRVLYDASGGHVRVAIHGVDGKKIWDTGRVPIYGQLTFDQITFNVRHDRPGASLDWAAGDRAIMFRASSWEGKLAGRFSGFGLDIYAR